jgi:hypothetical protein
MYHISWRGGILLEIRNAEYRKMKQERKEEKLLLLEV